MSTNQYVNYWIHVVPLMVLYRDLDDLAQLRAYSNMARKLLNAAADEITEKHNKIVVTELSLEHYALKAISKREQFERIFSAKADKTFKKNVRIPKNLESVVFSVEVLL